MKAGRFMVRVSRWMARSLHELATRFERWSGAASTPPPAAPPLPDPAMQALAERFPGAPDHWLRLVASRIGLSAAGATVGASPVAPPQIPHGSAFPSAKGPRFAGQPVQNQPRFAVASRRARGWNWPFGFGRKPNHAADTIQLGEAPMPVSAADNFAGSSDLPHGSARRGLQFNQSGRTARPEPRFPALADGRISPVLSAGEAAPPEAARFDPVFPEPANRASPTAPHWPVLAPTARPAGDTPVLAKASTDRAFAPIGGDWQSGYQVRQPSELRNIWPDLPPSEMSIADAQPQPGDDLAQRNEQAAARWSA